MRAAVVLQCTLVMLSVHVSVACQQGEVVKARWTDGIWMLATIVEVRERPDGICGQYRLTWHHNHICEDPTITGHDTRATMQFCLVSRDAIQSCKQELCRWGHDVESAKFKSSGTGADEEDNRHVALIIALVSLSLACCCICLRFCIQQHYGPQEADEEKGLDVGTPCGTGRSLKSGRSFWNFTPKSATSSPMAKWVSKTRRAAGPSSKHNKIAIQPEPVAAEVPAKKKVFIQPEPVAAVLPAKNRVGKLPTAEHVQPQQGTVQDDPLCPPVTLHALRHAARTHGGPSVPTPPQSICPPQNPPPQLPTLLQHRDGIAKSLPRKKPPLQGVPPQETTSEQAKKGQSSYRPRSRAPYLV